MTIIDLKEHDNGGHRNLTSDTLHRVPEGWAVFPDGPEVENFPFFHVDAAEEIGGMMTVTAWHPLPMPEPEPGPEPEPSTEDDINALLVDHEVRLTMLELGV